MPPLMTDVTAVRKGLATAADTITGLRALHYPPGVVNVPLFFVGSVAWDLDDGGPELADTLTVTCRLLASAAASERDGYELLDGYMAPSGPTSVRAALEADRTLGGVCLTLRCAVWTRPGVWSHGAVQYIGAELQIEVF